MNSNIAIARPSRVVLDRVTTNVGRRIRFTVNGVELEMTLVYEVRDWRREINVESPVGQALRNARVGDQCTVVTPDGMVVVNVLEVG